MGEQQHAGAELGAGGPACGETCLTRRIETVAIPRDLHRLGLRPTEPERLGAGDDHLGFAAPLVAEAVVDRNHGRALQCTGLPGADRAAFSDTADGIS